ncbi:MAG: XrtA-associated ATPase [Sphingopyxis sp.]|uniref:XrtA/PEP-CTERM system-associated ATPase n=1 Tax=Sphingopyxis sp. TaxID=1908224 RepID=UPI0032EDFFCA
MYDQFYGFTGRPFQLTPDPHFYFESGTHRKAMSYLGYGLAQGEGFIVITGDVGAGKTTLVGHLMNTIDANRLTAVKLVSTQVEGDDLLRLVAEQFGIEWEGESKAELLRSMEQYLREQARAGKRTLLIVDEGQNLAISALEELRMLSNFQLGGHSLLQIFLLGQPEFRQTLFHTPTLEQLRQRVIATHHLDPMEPEEVEPYILHRLGKVGWTGNPSFSPDAFEEIFDYSEGVPRKLNVLVSRLLLYGAVEQMNRITAQNVRSVIAEIEADRGIDAATLAPLPVEEVVAAAATAAAPTPAPFAAPAAANAAAPEWPRRVAEPGDEAARVVSLAPQAASGTDKAEAAPAVDSAQLAALEKQIAALEARLGEQDEALRRVLDLLIEWVERDPENAPNPAKSQTWAA